MRYRQALIPTTKDVPSDATSKSHVLLLRAGFIRRIGAGIYSYLPLGVRVLRKVERLVRFEMDAAGALEVSLPVLLPAEYFKETGRWDSFGDTLFRLKDRKKADYHLGPTHEEIISDLARRELHSYRDLPKNLYQVQTKFRDEPRPRGGLLRCREFTMKDAYSFDVDAAAADSSYERMREAYYNIFDRMGFDYRMVSADSGAMGGSKSAEFQILVQSGEDIITACPACDYAANLEVATPEPEPTPEDGRNVAPMEKVATPGKKTIQAVAEQLSVEPKACLKSVIYRSGDRWVLALVRGDHEVNESKLARALGVSDLELATEGVYQATGAIPGYAGPVSFRGEIVIDREAAQLQDAVSGANEKGTHLLHVQPGRDFSAEVHSIRNVVEGDACPRCQAPLKLYRGIEAGHIFLLGTHYSEKMKATFLDQEGTTRPLVMGCYGIGISRLVAAAIEQNHDDNGMLWPMSIAPYSIHIVQVGQEPEVAEAVARLESELTAQGIDILVDDREGRPGVKFKDADLIGIPLRVTIGAKALASGNVEVKRRDAKERGDVQLVPVAEATSMLCKTIQELMGAKD